MTQIIMTIGALVLLVGLVGLVKSIKGRLIPTPPYCRKCRYELSGLDIDSIGNCPECGRALALATRSVRHSRWRIRVVLLMVSTLFLGVGSIGLAWPKVTTLRVFDRIDLYSSWPDSAMLVFERVGDRRARRELYQRFMLGELSDAGVDRLTTLAIKNYVVSDDQMFSMGPIVIHLAMLEGRLSNDELARFIEQSVITNMQIRPMIESRDDRGYAIIEIKEPGFVSSMVYAVSVVKKKKGESIDVRLDSPYQLIGTVSYQVLSQEPSTREEFGSFRFASRDRPHAPITTSFPFPLEHDSITLEFVYEFKVMEGDKLVHAWSVRETRKVQRADNNEFSYATPIDDKAEINTLIEHLIMPGGVAVSTQIDTVRQFSGADASVSPVIHMLSQRIFKHSLMGDIRIRIGSIEIPYGPIVWKPIERPPNDKGDYAGWDWYGSRDLDEVLDSFDKYAEFWELALKVGKVDVLIIPNAELARKHPKVTSFVNRTIIFRDVPIRALEPVLRSFTNEQGETRESLRWQPLGGFKPNPSNITPSKAEILE